MVHQVTRDGADGTDVLPEPGQPAGQYVSRHPLLAKGDVMRIAIVVGKLCATSHTSNSPVTASA